MLPINNCIPTFSKHFTSGKLKKRHFVMPSTDGFLAIACCDSELIIQIIQQLLQKYKLFSPLPENVALFLFSIKAEKKFGPDIGIMNLWSQCHISSLFLIYSWYETNHTLSHSSSLSFSIYVSIHLFIYIKKRNPFYKV